MRKNFSSPYLACFAAMVTILACDSITSKPERSADEIPLDSIIQVRRLHPETTVRADTRSYDTVEARIPEHATTPVITFTTSLGFFELNNLQEVKLRAEADTTVANAGWLIARVVVRSDTFTIDGIVSALIGDYRDTVRIPFRR